MLEYRTAAPSHRLQWFSLRRSVPPLRWEAQGVLCKALGPIGATLVWLHGCRETGDAHRYLWQKAPAVPGAGLALVGANGLGAQQRASGTCVLPGTGSLPGTSRHGRGSRAWPEVRQRLPPREALPPLLRRVGGRRRAGGTNISCWAALGAALPEGNGRAR